MRHCDAESAMSSHVLSQIFGEIYVVVEFGPGMR